MGFLRDRKTAPNSMGTNNSFKCSHTLSLIGANTETKAVCHTSYRKCRAVPKREVHKNVQNHIIIPPEEAYAERTIHMNTVVNSGLLHREGGGVR